MKKDKYRIPVCIFLLVIGTLSAMALAQMIDDIMTTRRIITSLWNVFEIIGNILRNGQQRKLFFLLELMVIMLCIVYYVCAKRTYQADTYKVTDEITIPVPYGQGQHGTAWFMTEKEKMHSFEWLELLPENSLISKLKTLGNARYAAVEKGEQYTASKIIDETLCEKGGMVIGRTQKLSERLAYITEDVHTLTIGATRCGKSRCLVLQSICTLALAGEGLVVNDPKGELYHYTYSMLETLGYTIRVIDFNAPKKSDRYNPLQMIINAVNDNKIDDAQTYAWDFVTFLVEKATHSEPLWTNGEMAVIAASVLCVVYDNKDRPQYQNLTNVYNFIANMCKSTNNILPIDKYLANLPDSHPAKSLMAIAKIAPDRMGGSFYTSALTTLRLFVTNDMYQMTRESEFDLADVGKKPKQALFFILPDQKATYYPIVTLLVSQQYEQLVTFAKTKGNRLPHRVNFVLDEFGNFAAINDFQVKMTVAGGYGIRWNLFIQDFNQLNDKYDDKVAKIIEGNCHYWIYLHSNDASTNEEISKTLGIYTTSSYSLSGTTQKYTAPSSSASIQLSQRSLLTTDEILRIKRPYQLIISANFPAIMQSPDISKWQFNEMLGLGSPDHNRRLIEIDENSRPLRGGTSTPLQLWKPWERILNEAAAEQNRQQQSNFQPQAAHKQGFFKRGGIM